MTLVLRLRVHRGADRPPDDLDETWVFEAYGAAKAGLYQNNAIAYGTGPADDQVFGEDDSSYFGAAPSIDVEKYVRVSSGSWQDADSPRGPTAIVEMDVVYFKFVVTNNGNVTLTGIKLTPSSASAARRSRPS